jgi:hypothetical protein
MAWDEKEVDQTLAEVMKRASTDAEFRSLALRDAAGAIGKINPAPMPPGLKIRFVDNEGANRTFVLPDLTAPEGELSDAELEQVAGGLFDRCGSSNSGVNTNNAAG